MKTIIYVLMFTVSALAYSQESLEKKWSFGLNGKVFTTVNLVSIDKIYTLTPYIAKRHKNRTLGFRLTIGKTPIVGLYVIDNYPDAFGFHYSYNKTNKLKLNGGLVFYRFYFNSPEEFTSLFIETNIAVSYVYNEQHDQYYQDIIDTNALLKLGSRININDHLSLNVSGGVGVNCNTADKHYYRGYINNVGQDYKIYYRAMPSIGGKLGLEYQF